MTRFLISGSCTAAALLALAPTARPDVPPAWLGAVTNALGALEQAQVRPAAPTLEQAVTRAVLEAADPGARLLSGAEWAHLQEERSGRDFTLGLRLSTSNGFPCVLAVASNSPAARAGLQAGDQLTAVNGQELGGIGISRAALLVRGHTNHTLRIGYRRGPDTNEVSAALEPGPVPAVESADLLGSDLTYVRLNGLYPGTAAEVIPLLTNWQARGRFGIVLDLRGADGEDAASADGLAACFAGEGRLLYRWTDRAGQERAAHKAPPGTPLTMPLLVLVDRETTGAAELLAAMLAGGVRGVLLVGSETSGDPLVRQALPLEGGRMALVATRILATPDGKTYDGARGVRPEVAIAADAEDDPDYEPAAVIDRRHTVREELEDRALRSRLQGDAALHRAVDVLLGLKALNIRAFRADASAQD